MARSISKKKPPVKEGKSTEVGYGKPPRDTRWKPGQSGNPSGRPLTRTLSEDLRARLKEQYPGQADATYGRMLAHKLIDLALGGEIVAIREVFDRVEGKPRQAIDISIEEKKREIVNRAIEILMAEAQIERDAAVEQLAAITPEISEWVN